MKQELAGPSPSPLERLLAERITTAWLGLQYAEMAEAYGITDTSPRIAKALTHALDSANRRFLAATKALAVTRRLTNGLKIEINHSGLNAGGLASNAADGQKEVGGERLRDFFQEAAAQTQRAQAGVQV